MKKKAILGRIKVVAVLGLGMLTLGGMALADDPTSGYSGLEEMEQPQVETVLRVTPGYTFMADADYDHSRYGDLSVWRIDVPVRYTIKMEPGDLTLGAFYEHSEYNFDDLFGANGPSTAQFNTLAFDMVWKSMLNDNWGYFVYGAMGFSAWTKTTFVDGLTGTGAAGVRYVWSENLSLGLGLAVASQMEDDPMVLPVIALNWQIDDRWNLAVLNGAKISYDVTGDKKFLVDLGAKYQRREYRVRSDSALIEKMISAEVGATYNFSPKFGVRGFVGVAAGRNLEYRQDDDKVDDEDVDAAPFFGVRAFVTF